MTFWDHLFDSEYRQRVDIERLRAESMIGADQHANHRKMQSGIQDELVALQARVAKLELLSEALIGLLESRGGVSRSELAVAVTRLDLSDGYEDGCLGPNQSLAAPSCPGCGRPVNPRRTACVFCDQELTAAPAPEAPTRMVRCSSCNQQTAENGVFFSERGMVCGQCFET